MEGCGVLIGNKMTREESIEFYKRYSRKLFNVSFRIVGDSALAEEIMQDTVLKFFRFVEEGEMADRGGHDGKAVGHDGDSSLALRMTREPLRMTDVAGLKAIEAWLVRTCAASNRTVLVTTVIARPPRRPPPAWRRNAPAADTA